MSAIVLALYLGAVATVHAAPTAEAPGARSPGAPVSSSNAYEVGASVIIVAPVAEDLTAVGGTIVEAAEVAGDALLVGGSVAVRAAVRGDLRLLAGHATIEQPIAGDLAALALRLNVEAPVTGSVLVGALRAVLTGGAAGPVVMYGNAITLGGDFAGDVRVVAGDRLTLLPGTKINGSLTYQAPVPATIPQSATVAGGVSYTAASYLPGAGVSKTLALVSIGIFLFARVLASLILAGLLAGLFPRFAEAVIDEVYGRRMRHFLLTALLGFAAAVATPILILLLALTFIGLGLAILLAIVYALLILLALVYAGILTGGAFARRFFYRDHVRWSDGVLGTLALSLVALVPVIGVLIVLVLASLAAGALLQIAFRFAFLHTDETEPLV
ncbi:MAG TPA: hypothetical protein VJK73_00420 [Candidatus Paceibacterota bacterium]